MIVVYYITNKGARRDADCTIRGTWNTAIVDGHLIRVQQTFSYRNRQNIPLCGHQVLCTLTPKFHHQTAQIKVHTTKTMTI